MSEDCLEVEMSGLAKYFCEKNVFHFFVGALPRHLSIKLRVPEGVQHGVWTHLHSFLIIRESMDIAMLKP